MKKKEFISSEKHEKMFNNIKEVADITKKILNSLTIRLVIEAKIISLFVSSK